MIAMYAEASSSSTIHEVCYAPALMFNSRGDRLKRRKCRNSERDNLMVMNARHSLLPKNIYFYCFKVFDKFVRKDSYKYQSAPYRTSTFKSRLLFLAIVILFTILLSEHTRPSIALKCYETFNVSFNFRYFTWGLNFEIIHLNNSNPPIVKLTLAELKYFCE